MVGILLLAYLYLIPDSIFHAYLISKISFEQY